MPNKRHIAAIAEEIAKVEKIDTVGFILVCVDYTDDGKWQVDFATYCDDVNREEVERIATDILDSAKGLENLTVKGSLQ